MKLQDTERTEQEVVLMAMKVRLAIENVCSDYQVDIEVTSRVSPDFPTVVGLGKEHDLDPVFEAARQEFCRAIAINLLRARK